jgi:glucose 1-dehydrogenase
MKNKTAIVTGAGQGIGFEICRQLVEAGTIVILNDIDTDLTIQACKTLNKTAVGKCIAVPGDSSDTGIIRQMISAAVAETGELNMVTANSGVTLFGNFFDYPEESFRRVMQVNLAGSFFLTQQASLQMKKQASGGSIVLMSSVTGHQAHKDLAAYGMSKAALEMLAKNLVIELSQFKININTVAPGATLTERTLEDPGYEKIWSALTPMGRPASTADIANTVVFLLSGKAKHITGQSIVIDGGWTSISPSPF